LTENKRRIRDREVRKAPLQSGADVPHSPRLWYEAARKRRNKQAEDAYIDEGKREGEEGEMGAEKGKVLTKTPTKSKQRGASKQTKGPEFWRLRMIAKTESQGPSIRLEKNAGKRIKNSRPGAGLKALDSEQTAIPQGIERRSVAKQGLGV